MKMSRQFKMSMDADRYVKKALSDMLGGKFGDYLLTDALQLMHEQYPRHTEKQWDEIQCATMDAINRLHS